MRLVILDDYCKASEWAAKFVKKRINEFAPTAEKYFTLGLPTGKKTYFFFVKLNLYRLKNVYYVSNRQHTIGGL